MRKATRPPMQKPTATTLSQPSPQLSYRRHHVVLHLVAGERGAMAVPVNDGGAVTYLGEQEAELVVEGGAAADVGQDHDAHRMGLFGWRARLAGTGARRVGC
jgi:hypothetical protein